MMLLSSLIKRVLPLTSDEEISPSSIAVKLQLIYLINNRIKAAAHSSLILWHSL